MILGRTLVIGDIHSGLKALQQLLVKANVTEKDTLIFLGDYVDGWSDALETVNFLLELKKTHHCIFIRGNHDALCYEWLTGGDDNPTWFMHGGEATINSYNPASEAIKKRHIHFYEGLKNYYLDRKNNLFLRSK